MNEWAASGGGANDVYLGSRLSYRSNQTDGDNAFGSLTVNILRRALFSIMIEGVLLAILVQLVLTVVGITEFGFIPSALVFILVGFIPERQWVSQWELTLDGKASAAETAYAGIAKVLSDRQIPATVKTRRIRSTVGGDVRNYLIAERGRFTVYIGVLPFGTGLFMTWSMWLRIIRWKIIFSYFLEALARMVGRGSEFHEVIRTDPSRAFREAIHNAAREGIDLVVSGKTVTIGDVMGNVQIEAEEAIGQSGGGFAAPGAATGAPVPPRPGGPARPVTPPQPSGNPGRAVGSARGEESGGAAAWTSAPLRPVAPVEAGSASPVPPRPVAKPRDAGQSELDR